ncbi:MAG: Wzz/FepE/Etk N-terminal domain-containing protein [Azonexus sp.]|nr:Wzz/FepE/Etk N-terminal domain-containing protein [Azonexus sp.]
MNESEMVQDDEISLFDLWERLCKGWRTIVGGVVLGVGGALSAIVVIPAKYESVTTLQVGKVAGTVIEASETVVARLGSPAFLMEMATKIGDDRLLQELRENANGKGIVNVSIVKGTAMISLKVSGQTPDEVRKRNKIIIEMLVRRHDETTLPLKDRITADIKLSREKLNVVEREVDELTKASGINSNIKDGQFAPVSLLTSLRVQKQSEIFGLRQLLASMELSLLPPVTLPTQALEASYIADRPASPKRGLLLALGGIGGLLAGVLGVFVADAWRRAREERRIVD